jgi:hypothetical protein
MKGKVVKKVYEIFEWDSKGEYNLIEITDNHEDVVRYRESGKKFHEATWEVYESGEKRLMMCDAYSLIKRFGNIEK